MQPYMKGARYGSSPCYGELIAITAAGTVHVTIELAFSEAAARFCNVGTSLAFALYVIWRIRSTPGVIRIWGMRSDNFGPALIAQLGFAAVGVLALFGIWAVVGSKSLPVTFWMAVALYPIYGVIQQFALQNLIAKNLEKAISSPILIAVTAATLFGLSHFPRLELVALALVAGVFFTLIYRRFPNLWAVGFAHGILGALAVYLVLGEDPGAEILKFVGVW